MGQSQIVGAGERRLCYQPIKWEGLVYPDNQHSKFFGLLL